MQEIVESVKNAKKIIFKKFHTEMTWWNKNITKYVEMFKNLTTKLYKN